MKNVLKIILFTVVVTAFYAYVGQMVPQTEVHPPKDLAVGADMTPEQLAVVGKQIAEGKGTCMGCHTIGSAAKGRFPDLAGIGAKAGTRKPGVSAVDYLAEALYQPDAFIVEGFSPGMPAIGKAPINLSDAEMLAVIAYLQSLGGKPTVTPALRLKYAGSSPAAPAASPGSPVAPTSAAAQPAASGTDPQAPSTPAATLERFGCLQCHSRDAKVKTLGPSFHGMGKRLQPAQIYEAILDPDARIAKGYPAGVMSAMLKASGFYGKASAAEIRAMVDYLAQDKGAGK